VGIEGGGVGEKGKKKVNPRYWGMDETTNEKSQKKKGSTGLRLEGKQLKIIGGGSGLWGSTTSVTASHFSRGGKGGGKRSNVTWGLRPGCEVAAVREIGRRGGSYVKQKDAQTTAAE